MSDLRDQINARWNDSEDGCARCQHCDRQLDAVMAAVQPVLDELAFFREVLRVFAEVDLHGDLFWGGDDTQTRLYALVNDVFHWGTADCEEITPERLPVLLKAYDDLFHANSVKGPNYLADLYAARIRQMRPQGAAYPKEPEIAALFDACGPRRETDLHNPRKQP